MNEFGNTVTAHAAALASLSARLVPVATYFDDSDCVEFVKEDTFAIHRRIDESLTLIFDDTKIRLIGFKLKGFKCLYNEVLKPRLELKGVEFVELVPAIERAFTKLGQTMFPSDEERKRAYRAAWKLAEDEQVTIEAIAA